MTFAWDRVSEGVLVDLTVGAEPASVRRVRHVVVAALQRAGWTDCGPAALIATELVTNAAVHGTGPVRVRCVLADVLLIGVHDTGPTMPQPGDVASDDGRCGLRMVNALACSWGWEPDPPGKRVWARVAP